MGDKGSIVISFTGHRPERLGLSGDERDESWKTIRNWLEEQIAAYSDYDVTLMVGMANGVDILAGLIAIDNGYKLHCVLPCKGYGNNNKYTKELLHKAKKIKTMQSSYTRGCDTLRDKYMAEHCDVMLAVYDHKGKSGVTNTIKFAENAGKKVIVTPKLLF